MPILFLVAGLLNLSLIFNWINFKSLFLKIYSILFLSFLMAGFFAGFMFIESVSFNAFFLIAFLMLWFFLVCKCGVNLFDVIFVIVVGIGYYTLLNFNLSYLISYSSEVIKFVLFTCIALIPSGNFKKIALSCYISIALLLISGCFGYDNFGVFELDFLFCFDIVFYLCLYSLFDVLIRRLLVKRFYVRYCYVEKSNFKYSSCFDFIGAF